jgi:hypothetical protein
MLRSSGLSRERRQGRARRRQPGKRLGELATRLARLPQADHLAIPLRQVEMRIRDKTSVDKTPRAIYSSLTIDDHSLDRFGST